MFFKAKKDKRSTAHGVAQDTTHGTGTVSAESPYFAARQEWLERYGSYISRAAQWRMTAFACLGVAVLSLAGNLVQAQKATVIPYFVNVDTLGRATVTRVENPGAPPQALIQSELANIITNWRTVTADADLQRKMITRLSAFTTGAARGVVQQYFSDSNPYDLARDGKLVQVTLKGLPLPVSTDSWRVEWSETTRSHSGVVIGTRSLQATMRVQFQAPSTDEQIMNNPGGIYITELNFSSVLEPTR